MPLPAEETLCFLLRVDYRTLEGCYSTYNSLVSYIHMLPLVATDYLTPRWCFLNAQQRSGLHIRVVDRVDALVHKDREDHTWQESVKRLSRSVCMFHS